MFTKALVPLDGTEISEGIIPFITQLARGLEMGVVLATAVQLDARLITYLDRMADNLAEPVTGRDPGDRPAASDQLKESLAREIKSRLDGLADRMALEGIPTETRVDFGRPSETIIRMAQDSECDLIAMSTRGRITLASGLLGSVAYNIIHELPIPVLVIALERAKLHWDTDYGISNVIIPLDGSEFAESVLPYAASLSRKMDMGVTLVQVLSQDEFI
ncbi:MAG: universal stress protein [Dehalococcoidia bacterium]|nr:universal stress protein [Dehalococcoidia bacterium]